MTRERERNVDELAASIRRLVEAVIAGDRGRPHAHLVECFDDRDVGEPARAAAAKRQSKSLHANGTGRTAPFPHPRRARARPSASLMGEG